MSVLGEKIREASNAKVNNIKSFVWRGAKDETTRTQKEIRLVDATEDQLKSFYEHCKSMLYNTDKNNPGRFVLLEIIKDQRLRCNAELFLRYLENQYLPSDRDKLPRFSYLQAIKDCLNLNKEVLPKESWKEHSIATITPHTPEEFQDLSIDMVLDGCLDTLGQMDKRHITLNFLTKMGLWFTSSEVKDLTVKDEKTGKNRDRLEVVRERLGLKDNVHLKTNSKGLSYSEFRSMTTLRNKKYSELTTDQLVTLRNKVLFRLEAEVEFHIEQWKTRMSQIEEVAKSKGFVIE